MLLIHMIKKMNLVVNANMAKCFIHSKLAGPQLDISGAGRRRERDTTSTKEVLLF